MYVLLLVCVKMNSLKKVSALIPLFMNGDASLSPLRYYHEKFWFKREVVVYVS